MSTYGSIYFGLGILWTMAGVWVCLTLEQATGGRAVRWVADSALWATLTVVLWPLLVATAVLDWLLVQLLRRNIRRTWK